MGHGSMGHGRGSAAHGRAEQGRALGLQEKKGLRRQSERRRVARRAKTFLLRARGQTYEILVSEAQTRSASAMAFGPSGVAMTLP
jgi:hypothetical protein